MEALSLEELSEALLDRIESMNTGHKEALALQSFDLEQRIRELRVLFECSTIVQDGSLGLDEMLRRMVAVIPQAMVYPEEAYGVLRWGREVFSSSSEACSPHYRQAPLIIKGVEQGQLTIGYFPGADGRPHLFLKEEEDLLQVLAQHISRTIERMETHRILEESEAKLRLLLDFIPTGLNLVNSAGVLVQSNRRAREILGMEEENLRGRSIDAPEWKLIRRDGSPFPTEEFPSVLALKTGQAVEDVEMGLQKSNGDISWILVSAVPTHIPGIELAISYSDITERILTEQRLKESETRFRDLFEFSQDVLVLSDSQGRILNCNAAALRMFGLGSLEEALRFSAYDLYPDPKERDALVEKLRREGRVSNHEVSLKDPQGRMMVCLVSLALIQGRQGSFTILTTLHDITLRKQTEMQLTGLNNELRMLVEEKAREILKRDEIVQNQSKLAAMGEMVSSIAHQWRQPLNTLSLIIQKYRLAYQSGDLSEESLARSEEKALQLIAHLSQTINDFRFFYKSPEAMADFSLKEGVARACRIMEDSFRDREIILEMELEADGRAFGSINDLTQVVLNLLENSREIFQDRKSPHPRVTLRTFREGENLILSLKDNGGGIHPQVMPRIFDPYFTTRARGTGIGLHMCRMIVENKFRGSILARNWEEGAEFLVEIPSGS